jgi:hypothetical protein
MVQGVVNRLSTNSFLLKGDSYRARDPSARITCPVVQCREAFYAEYEPTARSCAFETV